MVVPVQICRPIWNFHAEQNLNHGILSELRNITEKFPFSRTLDAVKLQGNVT